MFHSVLKHVPWPRFERLVEAHGADARVRRLTTKQQYIALLYGQLSGAVSLREIVTRFLGTSENAVRIQVAVALIAFLLLRLAQTVHRIVDSPLAFARLIRVNLMHRKRLDRLLEPDRGPLLNPAQFALQWN